MKSITEFKDAFGIEHFRGQQEHIIKHTLENKNSLVLMPTGGGKSLCYQAPIFIKDQLGIIISPLISLMKDQVDKLRENGQCAHFLNSSLEYEDKKIVFNDLVSGECKYLYVAPETALKRSFINFIKTLPISLIAIDESHCISKWGHQFRPEYQELGALINHFPDTPLMALTATANLDTRKDIIQSLDMKDAKVFLNSFDRPNIYLQFERKANESSQLMLFLAEHFSSMESEGRGIIYCLSRKRVEMFSDFLKGKGYEVEAYHAGMPSLKREKIQNWFSAKSGRIVVATVAFGMGIDVDDIRFVVHMDLPKNIESYYQEIGRAGRDGAPSVSKTFYSRRDRALLMNMAASGDNSLYHREILGVNFLYGVAQSLTCRRKLLLSAFDEEYQKIINRCCDVCDHDLQGLDVTVPALEILQLIMKSPLRQSIKEWRTFISDKKLFSDVTRKFKNTDHGAEEIIFQLIAKGYLGVTDEGKLVITKDQFDEDFSVHIRLESKVAPSVLKATKKKSKGAKKVSNFSTVKNAALSDIHEEDLRELLIEFRTKQAKKRRVPAFKIFTDKTIESIIDIRPESEEDFLSVYGFGEKKVKKFANLIFNI